MTRRLVQHQQCCECAAHAQVTKLFGGNYDAAADWLSGRLSHGSTLDSGDWDSCIRENCALIPSYSEALLMDEEAAEPDERDADEHRSLVSITQQ